MKTRDAHACCYLRHEASDLLFISVWLAFIGLAWLLLTEGCRNRRYMQMPTFEIKISHIVLGLSLSGFEPPHTADQAAWTSARYFFRSWMWQPTSSKLDCWVYYMMISSRLFAAMARISRSVLTLKLVRVLAPAGMQTPRPGVTSPGVPWP
jgi:hypothetical protein